MKNTGRKKKRDMDFGRAGNVQFIGKGKLMDCLGYSPTNETTFYRLKAKGEIPAYVYIGGTIQFELRKAIEFYTKTKVVEPAPRPSLLAN